MSDAWGKFKDSVVQIDGKDVKTKEWVKEPDIEVIGVDKDPSACDLCGTVNLTHTSIDCWQNMINLSPDLGKASVRSPESSREKEPSLERPRKNPPRNQRIR